jgi:hypothetical protein
MIAASCFGELRRGYELRQLTLYLERLFSLILRVLDDSSRFGPAKLYPGLILVPTEP